MNNCSFYGVIDSIDYYDKEISLKLEIEHIRKNSSNKKIVEKIFLPFVAFDSGAETIYKNARVGDFLLIKRSTAKNDGDSVYFRIDEFKILKTEEVND